jgi:hypothetical protein
MRVRIPAYSEPENHSSTGGRTSRREKSVRGGSGKELQPDRAQMLYSICAGSNIRGLAVMQPGNLPAFKP